jgi:hypothetical protein
MTSYSVDLSRGITESFFKELENFTGSNIRLRKRLTEVTIELLQNISNHASTRDHRELLIQKEGSTYSVLAVSTVPSKDVQRLRKRITIINMRDHAQLKEQHTKILGKKTRSKKSGAGLGLYRIALRSASTLIPAFRQLDTNNFEFSLHVTLTA